jgi:hypothetical protein
MSVDWPPFRITRPSAVVSGPVVYSEAKKIFVQRVKGGQGKTSVDFGVSQSENFPCSTLVQPRHLLYVGSPLPAEELRPVNDYNERGKRLEGQQVRTRAHTDSPVHLPYIPLLT